MGNPAASGWSRSERARTDRHRYRSGGARKPRQTADTASRRPPTWTTRAATPAFALSTSTKTATLDVVFSNDQEFGIYLFEIEQKGWTRKVMAGKAGKPGALPKIVRDGTNNGFFVHSRHLWWQNEDTAKLPNLVDRRSFNDLLKDVEPRGKSPEASLKSIHVAPGFTVELVAAEPLVKDPIAFEWGADGKLWVVEMGDYPLGIDGKGKPGGVVRFLEDTNGDGRYDKQTTFLDGLGFPTGVMPWRNGRPGRLRPGHLLRRGPRRRRQGRPSRGPLHRLRRGEPAAPAQRLRAGPRWLDLRRQRRQRRQRPLAQDRDERPTISGRDFRFRPDTGEFEAESGQTQYGRHRDDWGHWFGNNNPNWGWHYVLADHDLKRNPYYAPPDPRQTLEPDTRALSDQPHARPVQRPGRGQPRHLGQQPDPLSRRALRARVRHQPVRQRAGAQPGAPDGARARWRELPRPSRAERVGPRVSRLERQLVPADDAQDRPRRRALDRRYVPRVIEHPEWIPDDWEAKLDLRAGSDQGRIYRVYPGRQEAAADPAPRPARHRRARGRARQPQRLAARHGPATAVAPPGPRRDRASPKTRHEHQAAQTRVQAIWTLADLGDLDEPSALAGLTDPDPGCARA